MPLVARLTSAPIEPAAALAEFMAVAEGAGAVVSFCGVARPVNKAGQPITTLRLEHHPRMTAISLERIGHEGMERFGVEHVTIVHRYGSIRPNEAIVFVAAASVHRRAAYRTADYLMDRLKTEAVFWKKEDGVDGGQWIEPSQADYADVVRWEE